MDDMTYSVVRSFNQFLNAGFTCGTDEQLLLTNYPGHIKLDKDTVGVVFYDENIKEIGLGRQAGTRGKARFDEFWVQIDAWSPPDKDGWPRQGVNRQLKDRVEQVFKSKVRVNLLEWDGTGGTTVAGGMFVRQRDASTVPVEEEGMKGWCRWRMDYYIKAVDYDS